MKKKDIIITDADNGSAVVIMDAEKYFNEASRKLSDKRSNNLLQVSWLMTQSTGLTKKTYSLKKWLTD